eukprot:5642557-Alexandrium_andersonii.AAC.1
MPRSPGSSGCPAGHGHLHAGVTRVLRLELPPSWSGIKSGPELDSAMRRWRAPLRQSARSHASSLKAE